MPLFNGQPIAAHALAAASAPAFVLAPALDAAPAPAPAPALALALEPGVTKTPTSFATKFNAKVDKEP